MTRPLAGLVAVVTGGAGHLGAAMTRTMAEQGARIVVADVDAHRADAHAAALADEGHDTFAVALDVASSEAVSAAFGSVFERFGGVDVLVNNAAPSPLIRQDAPALELELGVWDAIHGVVVTGALLCARASIPSMIRRGGGSIVNVASVHAHSGDSNLTAYAVAKAALTGLTRSLATQYGRDGVRCNTVTLGTIPFPSWSEEARASKVRHQLIGRIGVPDDVAELVAFLASPRSGFTTGADFRADGGVLAHLPAYADGGSVEILRAR